MDAAPPITHGHSRLTFVEADPFDLGPSSWGGVREAIRVKLTVDGKTLNAFVTHLDWPADDDWTDANEEHVQNRNNLAAKLDLFSGYKIFGGDFNAPYTRNSVQRTTITTLFGSGSARRAPAAPAARWGCNIHGLTAAIAVS